MACGIEPLPVRTPAAARQLLTAKLAQFPFDFPVFHPRALSAENKKPVGVTAPTGKTLVQRLMFCQIPAPAPGRGAAPSVSTSIGAATSASFKPDGRGRPRSS